MSANIDLGENDRIWSDRCEFEQLYYASWLAKSNLFLRLNFCLYIRSHTFLFLETADWLCMAKTELILVNTYEQSNPILEITVSFSGKDYYPGY